MNQVFFHLLHPFKILVRLPTKVLPFRLHNLLILLDCVNHRQDPQYFVIQLNNRVLLGFIRNYLVIPLNYFKTLVDFNTLRVHFLLVTL
jgi:hypothetical protein